MKNVRAVKIYCWSLCYVGFFLSCTLTVTNFTSDAAAPAAAAATAAAAPAATAAPAAAAAALAHWLHYFVMEKIELQTHCASLGCVQMNL